MQDFLPTNTVRCIIYRTTSIGDVVLASACLNVLSRMGIAHEVHWVGREPSLALVQTSFPDHHFYEISDDTSGRKVYEELTKISTVHLVLDLQKSLRSKRFCQRIAKFHNAKLQSWDKKSFYRASLILNAKLRGRSRRLPGEVITTDYRQYRQMSDAFISGLRSIIPNVSFDEVNNGQARPCLNFESVVLENDPPWLKELKFGRWLAVAPGASYLTKKAPSELFIDSLLKLQKMLTEENLELGLVFLGDRSDRSDSIALNDKIAWPYPTLNLCGKLSLVESGLALQHASGLLSNDSSLGHIAEATGVPVSILFGPTAEAFGFAPWMPESRTHSTNLGCRPCSKHGKPSCRFHDEKCFREIDTEKVASHLIQLVTR